VLGREVGPGRQDGQDEDAVVDVPQQIGEEVEVLDVPLAER
jgi:hypothetical protein